MLLSKYVQYIQLKWIIILLGISTLVFFSYQYISLRVVEKRTSDNKFPEEIAKKYPWMSPEFANSTVENIDDVLQRINIRIEDKSIDKQTRDQLLMQKAIRLAAQRTGTMNEANILESADILRSIYEETDINNEEGQMRKNKIAGIFLDILHASCFLPMLGESLPVPYNLAYKEFLDNGYHPKAAVMLAFRKFAYEVNATNSVNDVSIVARRAYLSGLYLLSFGQGKNAEDKKILTALQVDVLAYPDLHQMTGGIFTTTEAESALAYAVAFDVAHTYDVESVDDATLESIDNNYENALAFIGQINNDSVSRNMLSGLAYVLYLGSEHRHHTPENMDTEKINTLIDNFIQSVSSSKETKSVFGTYLAGGKNPEGEWMVVRTDFYEMARKYPKLQEFVESIAGIQL